MTMHSIQQPLSGRVVLRSLLALGVAALALAGCGGGDDSGGGGDPVTSLTITAEDFSYDPSSWSIVADTDVSVTIDNQGLNEHDWVVLQAGTSIEAEEDYSADMVETELKAVPVGETDSTTINLPAGEYQVICAVVGHLDAGMEGTLTVVAG